MQKHIEAMKNHTELYPWYWVAYGEKCYAFATVEAFPVKPSAPFPKPGTQLVLHEEKDRVWVAEDGTEMLIESNIAVIEQQNGDTICQFIAAAHAHFLGEECLKEDT